MKKICFVLTALLLLGYAIGQETNENLQFSSYTRDKRVKRQENDQPDPTDQFFDSVFQIPISTLNAVNGLIKSTRPVIRRARQRIQQQYQSWQQQTSNGGANGRPRPSGRAEE